MGHDPHGLADDGDGVDTDGEHVEHETEVLERDGRPWLDELLGVHETRWMSPGHGPSSTGGSKF